MAEIVFIHHSLIDQWGTGIRKVPDDFARKMVEKGVARLINGDLSLPKIEDNHTQNEDTNLFENLEDGFYNHAAWTGPSPDGEMIDIGERCGFKIHVVENFPIDIRYLLLSDFVVFSTGQEYILPQMLRAIKICLFEKQVPYVLLANENAKADDWTRQLATRAKLVVFSEEKDARDWEGKLGNLINPYVIVKNNYTFWRSVSGIVK